MLPVSQILNAIHPLTKEDERCGFKKQKKLAARANLAIMIAEYLEGKPVILPSEVLKMLV